VGGELNTANDSAFDSTVLLPRGLHVVRHPAMITVRAGRPANYRLTVTPVNGAFTNTITLP